LTATVVLYVLAPRTISFVLGTIVRVGCQSPNENQLSKYFLDFMILEELVKRLQYQWDLLNTEAQNVEKHIFKNGKIFISTLNYCGSSRMRRLIGKIGFIIVDEGKHEYSSMKKY
jgi:hypothetical protein